MIMNTELAGDAEHGFRHYVLYVIIAIGALVGCMLGLVD